MFTSNLKSVAKQFFADESGISAVEYGLLAAGIVVGLWAIVGGTGGIGSSLKSVFTSVKTDLASAAPGTP
ncbi:MAG TPA: Flp family type IVb pilin [Parvibaculum sp.]|uniref:Flp family type IVb pilin n=1 Tax=Parvibaculum sp. TaxID=2024848 RepID=UPI002C766DB0|nr:Flp family type IVb pilin [Parvibaculum sp.]HMM15445.1 Flp family type IVb pilin [Parvibaculum sp.]